MLVEEGKKITQTSECGSKFLWTLSKNDVEGCAKLTKSDDECSSTFFYMPIYGRCYCEKASQSNPCSRKDNVHTNEYQLTKGIMDIVYIIGLL